MASPPPEDSLSRALSEWHVAPSRHPRFRTEVWRRITAGRNGASLPWPAYVRGHAGAFAGALLIAVVLGAIAGRDRAHARVIAESARMANAYVQALDARSMQMP